MIAVEEKRNIIQSHQMQSASFGISQSGLSHILNILRNKLYSNKLLAIIREYSCNALDAHVAVGCPKKPIKVSLPSKLESTLKIRDYGPGLSEKEVFELYCFYGDSTKRTSNAYIGMMGIGSKSGFAYSDSFSVVSYQNGVKTIYDAFLDESNIGKIVKMGQTKTTESNGVEIVIAIKQEDLHSLASEVKEFFKYWDVKPDFSGAVTFHEVAPVLEGSNWKYYTDGDRSDSTVIVMGNVPYDLNWNNLSGSWHLPRRGLVIRLPIGAVQVAASREQLEYTPQTKEMLAKEMTRIEAEVVEIANAKLKACTNFVAATKLFYTLPEYIRAVGKVTWRQRVISQRSIPLHEAGYHVASYNRTTKRRSSTSVTVKNPLDFNVSFSHLDSLEYTLFEKLWQGDTTQKLRDRACTHFLNVPDKSVFILCQTADKPQNPALLKELCGKDFTDFSPVSKLEPWKAIKDRASGGPKTIYKLDLDFVRSFSRWNELPKALALQDTMPTSGYFIRLRNNRLMFSSKFAEMDMDVYRDHLRNFGKSLMKDFKEDIYVIPAMYKKNVPGLKPLEEYCLKELKAWANRRRITYEAGNDTSHADNLLLIKKHTGYTYVDEIEQALAEYGKAEKSDSEPGRWELEKLAQLYGVPMAVTTVKGVNWGRLVSEHYPLLTHVRIYPADDNTELFKELQTYFMGRDAKKTKN